jgi:TM2 domain-containing membrane protein YozV
MAGGRVPKDPGLAAVLSVVVPGVGQIYNGEFLRALFWLVVTPGFWIGTGGMLGWVCHLLSAWTAHRRATQLNARLARLAAHS